MTRIPKIDEKSAQGPTAELLALVRKKIGAVPNLISTLANSPSAAKAYLDFSQTLSSGALSARLREQIALAVAEANSCNYCVSAHTVLGKKAGLTEAQTLKARRAKADSKEEQIALDFVLKVVKNRGAVTDADLTQLRAAGYNDGEVTEIVANVALSLFTNYFNLVAGTETDFPLAPNLAVA